MAVPRILLDGSMAYGSRIITVSGVAYTMESFTVEPSTDMAEDKNSDGTPNRVRKTRGLRKWSGTLQLATNTTARPIFGNTFTTQYDPAYGSETYVFDDVPYEEDNQPNAIRTVKVTGHIALNPSNLTTVA